MEPPFENKGPAGDNSATNPTRASGSKRNLDDFNANQDNNVGSIKDELQSLKAKIASLRSDIASTRDELNSELTNRIASLKEELESEFLNKIASMKDDLESTEAELESAKAEAKKWRSAFKKESFIPAGNRPEPSHLIDYIQTLKSSEKSLKEKLEIAEMKLAICELKSQLILVSTEEFEFLKACDLGLDTLLDQDGNITIAPLLNLLRLAKAQITDLEEVQAVKLARITELAEDHAVKFAWLEKSQAVINAYIQQKNPNTVLPSIPMPEDDNEQN